MGWGYGFFDRRNLADGLSQTAYSEWYRGGQHDVVRVAPTGKELSIMWGYPSEERENMSEETELAIAADVCRREIKRYRLNETGGGILDGPLKLTHASQRYIYFPKEMRYNLIGTKLNGFGLSIDHQPIFEHHSTPNSSEENEVNIVGESIEMVINQLKQNKKDFLPPIEISFNAQSPLAYKHKRGDGKYDVRFPDCDYFARGLSKKEAKKLVEAMILIPRIIYCQRFAESFPLLKHIHRGMQGINTRLVGPRGFVCHPEGTMAFFNPLFV